MAEKIYDLIIAGSGPAGLTAAIYAARTSLDHLVIDGAKPGGQLMGTSIVDNWPGQAGIMGPELMRLMREQAQKLGCSFKSGSLAYVNFKTSPFKIITEKKEELLARSVIIATGATPKRLGVSGEEEYWGKGVTTCAVCDGAFYKNKPVVIVGGGDSAMEDASFMTHFTDDITVVHILDKLTASAAMQDKVVNNPKIKIIYESTIAAIRGDGKFITEVDIVHKKTGKTNTQKTAVLFVAIGLNPNTHPFKNQLELLKNGYIKLFGHTKTSVPGVFAAGDVADFVYRQAVTSAGTGCMAALDAERYLKTIIKNKIT